LLTGVMAFALEYGDRFSLAEDADVSTGTAFGLVVEVATNG